MQFCLIASLIARVHGKVRSLSKSWWLVQPIKAQSYELGIQLDLHNSLPMCGYDFTWITEVDRKIEMHITFENRL